MNVKLEDEPRPGDDLAADYHGAAELVRLSVMSEDRQFTLTLWLTPQDARGLAQQLASAAGRD